MTGTSPTSAATCRRRCGSSSRRKGFFAMIIPKKLRRPGVLRLCPLVRARQDRQPQRHLLLHRRGAQLPRARRSCSTTTAPRSRRTTTCRAWRAARKSRALRSPGRAPARMPPRFPDTGIVCRGLWQGREVLGLKLNFSKRYITLAPVATVIGLAFRMFDPEQAARREDRHRHHLRADPARDARRHHRPAPFPAQHPLPERADPGQGRVRAARLHHRRPEAWPAAAGACWSSSSRWGAASRCPPTPPAAPRRPCGPPAPTRASAGSSTRRSARFEGVESVIARMVGLTYTMDAARSVTAGGHRRRREAPRCPPAILKYHVTEMGRQVANDAMDVHGGKGICLGPQQLPRRAAIRSCRWPSPSRARTS